MCVVNVCVWCIVVEARGHWVYSSITLCLCPWIDRVSYWPSRPWFCLDCLAFYVCAWISAQVFMLAQQLLFLTEPSLQPMKKFWKTVWPHVSLSWFSNIVRNPTMLSHPNPSSLALYYLSSYYCPCSLVRVMTILLVTIVLQRCWVITAYCAYWHRWVGWISKFTWLIRSQTFKGGW